MKLQKLKSTLLLIIVLCTASSVSAQYNRQWDYGKALDIADVGNGEVITLATDNSADIILSHHDFFGNILMRQYYNLFGFGGQEYFEPYKIIVTPGGDYIVVGIYGQFDPVPRLMDYAPFAIRFNAAGVIQWQRIYQTSPTFTKNLVPGYTRANIVYVEDDPNTESYIITTPSDPHPNDQSYVFSNDVVVNALRINASGNPLWNKKYRLNTTLRQTTGHPYENYYAVESYPQALTYYDDANGSGAYFIAGTNLRWFNSFGLAQETFFMSIDRNGGIVRSTTRMNETTSGAGAYSWWNDALFDANTNEVVMVSSMPGWFGSGSSASVINITKFSNALAINSGDYYYHGTDVTENYAYDIEFDQNQNNYIIAAWVFDETTVVGNMSMLKVNPIPMTPTFYHRFTPDHSTNNSSIISVLDQFGRERYVMHGHPEPNYNSRLVGTDVAGDDWCRMSPLTPIHATIGFTAVPDVDEFIDVTGSQEMYAQQPFLTTPDYFCGLDYKKGGDDVYSSLDEPNTLDEPALFPNIVQNESEHITLQLDLREATQLNIAIYGANGQLVSERSFNGYIGTNKHSWMQSFPSRGVYMVRILSEDGAVQRIRYVTRQ